MYRKLIIILPLLALSLTAMAQSVKADGPASKITISGTSTLHDWTMEARGVTGTATVEMDGDVLTVKELTLTVPVKGLESGKSAMDKNAFEALEQKKHPAITYRLEKVEKSSKVEGGYLLRTSGTLTIAGKTCRITMDVKASRDGKGYVFSGNYPLKMTDYGVTPPTALLGTVKTGNEVTILFNVRYQ